MKALPFAPQPRAMTTLTPDLVTQALRTASNQPDVRERIERATFSVRALAPEELTAQIRSEVEKLRAVGKARGVTLND